jgi:hypothetical protein
LAVSIIVTNGARPKRQSRAGSTRTRAAHKLPSFLLLRQRDSRSTCTSGEARHHRDILSPSRPFNTRAGTTCATTSAFADRHNELTAVTNRDA